MCVLDHWFWDGFKACNGHARHRRKLGHSRETVAQRAARCGCSEFSHVKKMNLRIESFGELSCEVDYRRCYIGKINWNKDAFHSCGIELTWRAASAHDRDS